MQVLCQQDSIGVLLERYVEKDLVVTGGRDDAYVSLKPRSLVAWGMWCVAYGGDMA